MKTKVSDWMTTNPITIDADATVVDAIRLLKEKRIRRLPVMKRGKLVGLVTEKMLLDYSPSKATTLDVWEMNALLSIKPISEVMNPKPHTVSPDTELGECAQIIHDRKLNGITVLDQEGHLVGIFTTTDALNALIWFTKQVREVQR
jgi:acetoin utilization protein AcuB